MGDNGHEYPQDCPFRGDHDTITRIDARIEHIHDALYGTQQTPGVLAHLEKLNGRTRKNEVNIARVMAVAAFLAVVVPIIVELLWRH